MKVAVGSIERVRRKLDCENEEEVILLLEYSIIRFIKWCRLALIIS